MATITIALDAMGGDQGLAVVVPAAAQALTKSPELRLILVGDQTQIEAYMRRHSITTNERLQIHHASEQVSMDELPSHALRNKKDSSMRVAINLVSEGKAQACVSAGNTGALMVTARFVLKTLPGIDRPAISSVLPGVNGGVRVLDLGANVDCKAEHLFQFAVMGSVLAEFVDGKANPKIALLNIGAEDMKGNEQVKQTAQLLSAADFINYIGYMESDDIFFKDVDVVVCDGFVGNVALKTMEGTAKVIASFIKSAFEKTWLTRLMAIPAMQVLNALKKEIDPSAYNGASFVGLPGTVIKSHGGTNVLGFTNAIHEAVLAVKNDVPQQIRQRIANLLQDK